MKAEERSFKRDEVIFREGDAGDAVYVVKEGRAELLKNGAAGPVIIASLGQGEMLGEMGVLDDGPRNSSAIAATDCLLRVVTKKDFRLWMTQDPEAAFRIITLLVDRLRRADDLIATQRMTQTLAGPTIYRRLFLGVRGWLQRRLHLHWAGAQAEAGTTPTFAVGIAAINNDVEGAWGRALLDLLQVQPGLSSRSVSAALQVEPNPDQAQANAALLRARQVLAREGDLDLLIWGDVHADGFTLRLTSAGMPEEERPGAFLPYLSLELAGDMEAPAGELLALASLAAIEPLNDSQRALHRQLLPAALQAMGEFLNDLPVAWNLDQQRTALVCYGHAAATIATFDGDADWFDHAGEAYQAAINRLPAGEHGLEQALLRRYLGGVLAASGEKRGDMALIEKAADELRESVECLVRSTHPQEWAAAQNRLGLTLNKLEHLTSQPDLLKEALGAFQAASQVFTRAEAPQRFSDTMFNLAQILLVYGDQVKNDEVLERAVAAARASLEYRSRDRNPAAWAAGRNALGTALFLLDKHGRSSDHVDEAREALTDAAETYRALGAVPQAKIAERNRDHVDKLAKAQAGRKVAKPEWADDNG